MSTIAAVEVITEYFMIFGLLFGDIKIKFSIPILDRLSKKSIKSKTFFLHRALGQLWECLTYVPGI